MTSIFKDSNAPYVLAILVGALSWLLNSAIAELRDTRFIEYTISYSGEGKTREATVRLQNRSMSQPISVGAFVFQCLLQPGQTGPCFRELPGSGQTVEFVRSGSIWLRSDPMPVTPTITTVNAVVPPRAQVAYRMGLVDNNAEIRVGYDLAGVSLATSGGNSAAIIFVKGPTIEGFVLANYLKIIIYSLLFFGGLFSLWISVAFVRFACGKS
ncbi:MAG: hypothetical protein K0S56_4232 [Microvirga sp.]|nr:hypothetical protein [Microvirga sp.]